MDAEHLSYGMSEFQRSIRTAAEHHNPSVIIGARIGKPGEEPQSLRDKVDPWAMWTEQAAQSTGVNVEIASSQRLGKDGNEDAVVVLAGLRLVYMKLVADIADGMNIPEGELHNRINETLNSSNLDDSQGGPPTDDDNPMFNR
jgi:hypothetical protein